MTPKGGVARSRDLLLKQWDRYPRSTERISCFISFLFSLFIIINNNIIISYSGVQLDGPVAFLAACPYIILYSFVILCIFWK